MATSRYWVEWLAMALAVETRYGPTVVARVKYEDLLRQPEAELRRLCAHIGVQFEASMPGGAGYEPGYTRNIHTLVGGPPDPSRGEAWRTELTPRQIELFEFRAGRLLQLLGYEPIFANPRKPSLRENLIEALREFARSRMQRRGRPSRLARDLGLPQGTNPLRPNVEPALR